MKAVSINLRQGIADAVQRAVTLQIQGRLEEAESGYQSVLKLAADNFDALHMLGVIRTQQGRYEESEKLIRAALKRDPRAAAAYVNLGNALQGSRRYEEAARSYRKALSLEPNFAEAYNNLGSALNSLEQFAAAIPNFKRALALNPKNAEAYNNIGNAMHKLGRDEEAIPSYHQALLIRPNYAEAHYNLGNALLALSRHDEAMASYDRAIEIKPDFAEPHSNRGSALLALNRHEDAIASCRRALAINPGYAEAYNNLGLALAAFGRYEEAAVNHRKAIAVKADMAPAYMNLASALSKLTLLDQANESYERARELAPEDVGLQSLHVGLKRRMCNWTNLAEEEGRLTQTIETGKSGVLPFVPLVYLDDPQLQMRAAQTHIQQVKFELLPHFWNGTVYAHEKIRIAYLSADFHEHATAYLMAELFERHDRGRFEITAFSWGRDDKSAMRRRLEAGFDRFLNVRAASDVEIAHQVRDLEIDIAVDLKGYTEECRPLIFARRPAPIQVNYLGYPGTMGASFIDYILVDPFVVPAEQQEFFTEKLVHLPECYQPNDGKREIAAQTPARAECGLPERGFVFACFNNNHKITPAFFDIWMRLLRAVPGSVLWLLQDNPWTAENLRGQAQARDVSPDRLVFAPRCKLPEHLARQRLADLFLDTLPYNAHTTTSDALWAGLPVLTCAGRSFAARVAGSLLRAAGLPELVTHSIEDYEALALKLARDPGLLAGIRRKLAANRLTTPLFDCERYCRHLEAAYQHMWRTWQNGEPPRPIAVPALPPG